MILFLLLCCVSWCGGGETEAAVYPELHSQDELYACMVDQINAREVTRTYTVKDQSLRDRLVHIDLSDFATHFNPDAPLDSGCYLVYYLETVYLSYYGSQFKIMIRYPHSKEEMDAHFNKMKSLARELKGETEYDTVKNVHDYLIENFEYDQNTTMVNHTDIDGFRDGVMVCSGYSLATYYLLNSAGVSARVITGNGGTGAPDEENHMWNMVRVDGKWYNMDVTWDDGGGKTRNYEYFLKSDADFPEHRRLGRYNTEPYNTMVSDESYPVPFVMKYKKQMTILIAAFVGTVLLIILLSKRKKPQAYRGYVVNSMETGETDYESWRGGNGVEADPYSGLNSPYGRQDMTDPDRENDGGNDHV